MSLAKCLYGFWAGSSRERDALLTNEPKAFLQQQIEKIQNKIKAVKRTRFLYPIITGAMTLTGAVSAFWVHANRVLLANATYANTLINNGTSTCGQEFPAHDCASGNEDSLSWGAKLLASSGSVRDVCYCSSLNITFACAQVLRVTNCKDLTTAALIGGGISLVIAAGVSIKLTIQNCYRPKVEEMLLKDLLDATTYSHLKAGLGRNYPNWDFDTLKAADLMKQLETELQRLNSEGPAVGLTSFA